ncbi:Polycystic kidney disease protein 1-like 2 [Nymphon striatum]|nr:Polycystic kidney disease protein 1-like 2 [Nymphon striatum]
MFKRNVEIQPIMTGNVALDQVDRYTYLEHRDWEPEVRRRVALETQVHKDLTMFPLLPGDIFGIGNVSALMCLDDKPLIRLAYLDSVTVYKSGLSYSTAGEKELNVSVASTGKANEEIGQVKAKVIVQNVVVLGKIWTNKAEYNVLDEVFVYVEIIQGSSVTFQVDDGNGNVVEIYYYDGIVNCDLTFLKTQFPTNATVEIDFGVNGFALETREIENMNESFTHAYTEAASYTVNYNVSNAIDSSSGSTEVIISQFVDGVKCSSSYYHPIMGKISGSGRNKDIFRNDSEIELHITYETEPGICNVKVLAPIGVCSLQDSGYVVAPYEVKEIILDISDFGDDTYLIVHFGDSNINHIYGNFKAFLDNHVHDLEIRYTNENISISLNHTYELPDSVGYNISVKVENAVSRSICSLKNVVILPATKCQIPKVKILDGTSDIKFPLEKLSADRFKLYSETTTDCEEDFRIESSTKWEIFTITFDEEGYEVSTLVLEIEDENILEIGGNKLDIGMHKICFIFRIVNIPIYGSDCTYLDSKLSPLTCKMTDGFETEIKRGFSQFITLTPGTSTIDPDRPNQNLDFKIFYFCKKVGIESEYTLDNITSSTVFPDTQMTNPELRGGDATGCFRNAKQVIDFKGQSEVTFRGTQLSSIEGSFEFTAVVTSSYKNQFRKCSQLLIVQILRGAPPSVTIRCSVDDTCIPYSRGVIMNRHLQLVLELICESDCGTELDINYHTKIGLGRGDEIKILDDCQPYLLERSDSSVKYVVEVSKTCIQLYENFHEFAITMTKTTPDGVGNCTMYVKINEPVRNGTCLLTYSQYIIVNLVCENWIDPEDAGIEEYALITVVEKSGERLVKTQNIGKFEITRRLDTDLKVYVSIKDRQGAITEEMLVGTVEGMPKEEVSLHIEEMTKISEKIALSGTSPSGFSNLQVDILLEPTNNMGPESVVTLDDSGESNTFVKDEFSVQQQNIEMINLVSDNPLAMVNVLKSIDVTNFQLPGDRVAEISLATLQLVTPPIQIFDKSPEGELATFTTYFEAQNSINTMVALPEEEKMTPAVDVTDLNPKGQATSKVEAEKKAAINSGKSMIKGTDFIAEYLFGDLIHTLNSLSGHVTCRTGNNAMKVLPVEEKNEFSADGERVKRSIAPASEGNVCGMNTSTLCNLLSWKGVSCTPNTEVGESNLESHKGLFSSNTSTVTIGCFSDKGKMQNDQKNIAKRVVKIKPAVPMDTVFSLLKPSTAACTRLIRHQISIDGSKECDAKLMFAIRVQNDSKPMVLFMKNDDKPLLEGDQYRDIVLINDLPSKYDGSGKKVFSRTFDGLCDIESKLHIAFAQVENTDDITSVRDTIHAKGNFSQETFTCNMTEFEMAFVVIDCSVFDDKSNEWRRSGMIRSADMDSIDCEATEMDGTFGGGFIVQPNVIDFDYVFENASFVDNLTIYLTICISFGMYLIMLVWCRRKDRQDIIMMGAAPLPDNNLNNKYIYEILVFTSSKPNSGTDSQVRSNGRIIYANRASLGQCQSLRLWHDNSGKGNTASWLVDFIVIRDVQTNEKYKFIAHRWWGVEKDDGQIDRVIPVSGQDEMTNFKHLYETSSSRDLRDGHLWLSVFLRPPRSRFTRVQRLSSCLALLYLSMLVNIMWYGTVPAEPGNGLKIGPFSLSPAQIGVGIMANLIVFLPSLIIITLFRKSRPKVLRESRITVALEKQREQMDDDEDENYATESEDGDSDDDDDDSKVVKTNEVSKKKITFPHWCVYIAWFLTVACIGISMFFLWAYGITFGNEKTTKWFTSLIISILASIFLTQPVKVMLVAFVLSLVCKNIDNESDDADEDEEQPELADDEEWLHASCKYIQLITLKIYCLWSIFNKKGEKIKKPKVLDLNQINTALKQRKKEMQMIEVSKEVICYIAFILLLLILSYGNRDPSASLLNDTMVKAFIKPGDYLLDFDKVLTTDKFYTWIRKVLLPELIIGKWYNDMMPYNLNAFLNDRCNLIIGVPMLRQIRVEQNSCPIHSIMWDTVDHCGGYSRIMHEDRKNYGLSWDLSKSAVKKIEYTYQSSSKLKNIPFWGLIDWYGGGGYIYPLPHPLRGKEKRFQKEMFRLEKEKWIDKNTRAVIVDFSVYNAQVNLFVCATILAEYQPGGGIIPYYRFDVIRLMRYHDNFGLFTLICEILFFVTIVYFTIREVRAMIKLKKGYFKSVTNLYELTILFLSYSAIVLFIQREMYTVDILKLFTETKGTGYVRLQRVAAVDEVLSYVIGFLVFLANLKFLYLLRFNKRIGILAATLKECANELSNFCVCLLILFISFVILFHLLLCSHMAEFSDMIRSAESSFTMMLGRFKFNQIKLASPFLGPLVFFIFSLTATLVMVNLLLTILMQTFEEVKHNVNKTPNDYEIVEFVVNRVRMAMGLGKKYRAVEPDVQIDKDQMNDNKIKSFPRKVDKFVGYINKIYFPNTINGEQAKAVRPMKEEPSELEVNHSDNADIMKY